MPRPRRSVTFWRGSEPKNPRFEPPRSRWAGTAVQKWPPWYCRELRTELLRVRAAHSLGMAELVAHANRWARQRKRPAGVSHQITKKHVSALLYVKPARAVKRPAQPERNSTRATRRPTAEDMHELARQLGRAAETRKAASGQQASTAGARTTGSRRQRSGAPRRTARKRTGATPKSQPQCDARRSGAVVIVRWGRTAGAAHVRVDLLDQRARRIARAKADASVGAVTFKKPPSDPLTVELLATSPSGRALLKRCMRVLRSSI